MDKEQLLQQAKEKRQSLLDSINTAKSLEELDRIELDIRKVDHEIEGLEQQIQERNSDYGLDPAARRYSPEENPEQRQFNPLATFRNKRIEGVKNKDIFGGIALRKGDFLENTIEINEEERELDIGKYVRGIVTGNWEGAELEKRSITTSTMGTLIPTVLSARIIDVARNKSLFTNADVPIIPMESNNLTISRVKSDPVFNFKEEGAAAKESNLELESIELKSKTCYGYAYVSLEAIESSKNLSQVITSTFANAIANAIDLAMLYGQYNTGTQKNDDFAPKGVMNDELINKIEALSECGYDDFIKAISQIKKNNGEPSVYAINADTEEYLSLLKDNYGRYLESPKQMQSMNQIVSNQLKNDISSGSDALVFSPEAMLIGIQKNVVIEMFSNTDECIEKGLVGFRIYSMLDCATTQPKHICKITGINKQS